MKYRYSPYIINSCIIITCIIILVNREDRGIVVVEDRPIFVAEDTPVFVAEDTLLKYFEKKCPDIFLFDWNLVY